MESLSSDFTLEPLRLPSQPEPTMDPGKPSTAQFSFPWEPEEAEDDDSLNADCCDVCDEHEDELFFCQACKWKFCAGCWKAQAVHNPKRKAAQPVAAAHEKIALSVVKLVQPAFQTPPDDKSLEKWLADEEDAAWFGVGREFGKDSPLFLHDYGRYAGLLATMNASFRSQKQIGLSKDGRSSAKPRAPSLVSFVGQTGAGKSTLIKLLIQINETGGAAKSPRPVAGLPGKDVPTSEDVHLYLDPGSSLCNNPLLYADCEGIDGGAREPMATTFRNKREAAETHWDVREDSSTQSCSKRELQWAKSQLERTRQFAVAKFYPRLLFTFSDTVVFVHRNPRTVETVLEKLLEWATDALEASSNHPVLPYAIIVLNTSHSSIHQSLWDVDVATKSLLESLSKTLNQNVVFTQYAKFWKARGREIETVEDLMLCYYSSIRVVHIPADTQPKLVFDQAQKLYQEIQTGCKAARERKADLRMLLDEDSLQHYLQHAFDHYSRTLEIPFDFVQASFLYNPIPANFGGSILKLAITLKDQQTRPDARAIFQKLSRLVASCILLDAARDKILGTADHIFPHYIQHLDYAMSTFCDRHWPCEFVMRTVPDHITYDLSVFKYQNDLKFDTYFFRCANLRCGHGSKGHQLEDGRILSPGKYLSSFSFENNREEFHGGVYYILEELLSQLPGSAEQETLQRAAAITLHRNNIQEFLHTPGGKENKIINLSDKRVCWSCLFEPPEHTLSCGHVLCTPCVKEYGQSISRSIVQINGCPFEANRESKPQSIYFKPEAAGIRVLVLDAGGIRGLLQIEVLRLLENEFKNRIPVRFFFDIVIGSGSGSIPALGLFVSHWTMDECEDNFSNICKQSFVGDNVHRFRTLSRRLGRSSKSKYGAANLEKSLKEALTDTQPLFGGANTGILGTNVKVAVPAISSSGKATLFPNYNRQSSSQISYNLFRPENEQKEIKLWEAARASMSYQLYFTAFKHQASNDVYSYRNTAIYSPITIADAEFKEVWRDTPSTYPDLLLWIGTGVAAESIAQLEEADSWSTSTSYLRNGKSRLSMRKQKKASASLPEEYHDQVWDDYLNSLPLDAPESNFKRLNVKVPEPPAADDIGSIDAFQNAVRKGIDKSEISKLASRIFASFFYFDGRIEETPSKELFLRGEILCRISDDTPEIREIGLLLQDGRFRSTGFIIDEHSNESRYFGLTSKVLDDMIFNTRFRFPGIKLRVSSKTPLINIEICFHDSYSISGFPRTFQKDQNEGRGSLSRRESGDTPTISRRPQWNPPDRKRYSFDSTSSIRSFGGRSQSSFIAGSSSTTVSSPRELEATPKTRAHELNAPDSRHRERVQEAMRVQRLQNERDRIRNEEVYPLEDILRQLEDQQAEVANRLAGLKTEEVEQGRRELEGKGMMVKNFPLPPGSPPPTSPLPSTPPASPPTGLSSSRTSTVKVKNRNRHRER